MLQISKTRSYPREDLGGLGLLRPEDRHALENLGVNLIETIQRPNLEGHRDPDGLLEGHRDPEVLKE